MLRGKEFRRALAAAGAAGARLATLEALHSAAGVDQLLAARVERVAVGADLNVELGLGRARGELVAACTADVRLDVLGMDAGLHLEIKSRGTRPRRTPLAGGPGGGATSRACPAGGAVTRAVRRARGRPTRRAEGCPRSGGPAPRGSAPRRPP